MVHRSLADIDKEIEDVCKKLAMSSATLALAYTPELIEDARLARKVRKALRKRVRSLCKEKRKAEEHFRWVEGTKSENLFAKWLNALYNYLIK